MGIRENRKQRAMNRLKSNRAKISKNEIFSEKCLDIFIFQEGTDANRQRETGTWTTGNMTQWELQKSFFISSLIS